MSTPDNTAGKIGPFPYHELAVWLRMLRETMNLRQDDLADISPVTTRTIKRIEKGVEPVRPYHLEGVCQALGFELKLEMQYTLIPIKSCITENNPKSDKIRSIPGPNGAD